MRNLFKTPGTSMCSVLAGALLLSACETEDPRVRVPAGSQPADEGPGNDTSDRGFGELCGENTPSCQEGLTCYQGTCTPSIYAEACAEPTPCGEGAQCYARGQLDDNGDPTDENLVVICNCPTVDGNPLEWNGVTCVKSEEDTGFPTFSGSILAEGETCPGPEGQPGVIGAVDCPENSFCDADTGGRCLEYNFSATGSLSGASFAVSTNGLDETTVQCTRKYLLEEDKDPENDGITLTITGALASAIVADATEITVDVSGGDLLDDGSFLIFPQENAPDPRDDSVFASLSVGDDNVKAIGGRVTIDSVGGDVTDGLINDGEGWVGGSYFVGLPNDEFMAFSFVVGCGDNITTEVTSED